MNGENMNQVEHCSLGLVRNGPVLELTINDLKNTGISYQDQFARHLLTIKYIVPHVVAKK